MTAKEFVSRLAPVDLDRLALIFNFLADHEHDLQLESGLPLRDGIDFEAFHREVATACKSLKPDAAAPLNYPLPAPVTYPLTGSRFSLDFCARCGHIHLDDDECGFPMGGGGKCPCRKRAAVPA
jgi:hypothetical protein